MAEDTLFLTGEVSSTTYEVACTAAGMVGSAPLQGWITSVLGGVPYSLATIRSVVVPQLPKLFDTAYTVQDYADTTAVPQPVIRHLVPESIDAGGDDVTLHVHGAHFTPRSQIVFNGSPEVTTFVSTTELTTTVVGATATTPGRYPVQVQTAAPGGGLTPARWFYVLSPDDVTVKRCTADQALCWEVPV